MCRLVLFFAALFVMVYACCIFLCERRTFLVCSVCLGPSHVVVFTLFVVFVVHSCVSGKRSSCAQRVDDFTSCLLIASSLESCWEPG